MNRGDALEDSMAIKNVIFNWSGTLSDNLTPVYKASMLVFEKLGRRPISFEEYRREFTLPYMIFWNKYFPDLTKEEENLLFTDAIHQVEDPVLYPGVKDMVHRLELAGVNMVVISSHPHEKLVKEVAQYGLQRSFREVIGSVHDKVEIIEEIVGRNNFNPSETIFVGDMTHDIVAGKKASVKTVAIGWGYQAKEALLEACPDHFISDIAGLNDLLE